MTAQQLLSLAERHEKEALHYAKVLNGEGVHTRRAADHFTVAAALRTLAKAKP